MYLQTFDKCTRPFTNMLTPTSSIVYYSLGGASNLIRSTKTTLKFCNVGKQVSVDSFLDEYRRILTIFVGALWNLDKIPRLLPKDLTDPIDSWLSARMIQCAGKQASGIVRGTRTKQEQRLFRIKELKKEGKFKQTRKLQRIYDHAKVTKPKIDRVEAELDSRFVEVDLNSKTKFVDGWLILGSVGNKQKIIIPFRKSEHFNKMLSKGIMKKGVRVGPELLTFMFDLPNVPEKTTGETVGIDIGKITTISCSNGFQSRPNKHGHDLNSILEIMARKQKGSKGFKKCQAHRLNYIHWSINQLNLQNVRQINLERMMNVNQGRRVSRTLARWTYRDIFGKLETCCEEQGVLVQKVSPTYTSQRCSKCGWTRKNNRKGTLFKCGQCGNTMDADLNASLNIALELPEIGRKDRLKGINRKGFYWFPKGQESIVPAVKKALK